MRPSGASLLLTLPSACRGAGACRPGVLLLPSVLLLATSCHNTSPPGSAEPQHRRASSASSASPLKSEPSLARKTAEGSPKGSEVNQILNLKSEASAALPHQRVSTAPPPTAPEKTPADPGAALPALGPLPAGPATPPTVGQKLYPGGSLPPTVFNPDPGAAHLPAPAAEPPLFPSNVVTFPRQEFDPVPADQALPRGPLYRSFLIPGRYLPVVPAATIHPGNFDPIRPGWEIHHTHETGGPPDPASSDSPQKSEPSLARKTAEGSPKGSEANQISNLKSTSHPASPDSPASALKSEISNLKSLSLPRENTVENLPVTHRWHPPENYPLSEAGRGLPPNSVPVPDRWHAPFASWRRYTGGDTDELPFYHNRPELWHPYRQSLLKGDLPIRGQDIFLSLTASSETVYEDRLLPVPSGASANVPGSYDFFGNSHSSVFVTNVSFDATLFKGETVFMPVEWAVKIKPVFNYNHVDFREAGIVNPDPRGSGSTSSNPPGNGGVTNPGDIGGILNGGTTPAPGGLGQARSTNRDRTDLALQEAFVEVHLADLSPNYDFLAVKAGNQTFNSDFRGFIFNDTNLGVRLFGNYGGNLWQYNLAVFDMRKKDSNSELITFEPREQQVVIANLYRQDCFWKGYTTQFSFHANLDHAGKHFDGNKFLAIPAPLGTPVEHEVNVGYLGWAGDGHIGRWNVSHALYLAAGRDGFNGLAGRPAGILAHMAAVEVSYDQDWIRCKASAVYASGDGDATDGRATGFDSIVDNNNFVGGPFSYYNRQGFNLAGTAVGLKQRHSLLPDLRTSKANGQANFVNPGVVILGLGAEMDLTPKVRMFLNANHISFAETDPLRTALHTNRVDSDFGLDLSIGFQWRPLLTDNIILSLGYGALLPGDGFKDIYRTTQPPVPGYTGSGSQVDRVLHSAVAAVTFTY